MQAPALYRGKRVLLLGLGMLHGGVATARFFARQGSIVRVTDLKSADALKPSIRALKGAGCTFVLGRHRAADIRWADIVVVNPAVPFSSPWVRLAKKLNKKIENDASIFFQRCPAPIIGVTGTKGKSTTAALIASVLRRERDTVLVGWNDAAVLNALPRIRPSTAVIFELSSFRLEGLALRKKSPHIAVITSFFPDHLNHHGSFEAYQRAKAAILLYQRPQDSALLNADDAGVRRFASIGKGKKYWYGRRKTPTSSAWAAGNGVAVHMNNRIRRLAVPLRQYPVHRQGAVFAAASVGALLGLRPKKIEDGIRRFRGVPGRLQTIRTVRGIRYINDTASTVPEATIAALRSIRTPIVLLGGGSDKKLSYDAFAKDVSRSARFFILFPGSATDKILLALKKRKSALSIAVAKTMTEAMRLARAEARTGDTVLLSPGAASFGVFRNEFDRGRQFNARVRALRA